MKEGLSRAIKIENRVNNEPEKSPIHLREWSQVLCHLHSKMLPSKYNENLDQKTLQNWQDAAYTIETMINIFSKFDKKNLEFSFVDSDHAGHSADFYHIRKYPGKTEEEVLDIKNMAFLPDSIETTVDFLSNNILLRKSAVDNLKKLNPDLNNRLYSGVEVDIIGEGVLDISNKTLLELDCVGAAYHTGLFWDREEWSGSNGGRGVSLSSLLNSYDRIVDNPAIDVIFHPILCLDKCDFPKVLDKEYLNRWNQLFSKMSIHNTCLEINIVDLITPRRTISDYRDINFQLFKMAKNKGVKFMFGMDFHRIEKYMKEKFTNNNRQTIDHEATSLLSNLESHIYGDGFLPKAVFIDDSKVVQKKDKEILDLLSKIFKKSDNNTVRNLSSFIRPIWKLIRDLQEIGIEKEDIVNGNKDVFQKWIYSRRLKKEEYKKSQK